MSRLTRNPLLLVAAVIVLYTLFGLALHTAFKGKWNEAGQFGDAFGLTTSLFSALALVLAAIAFFTEREADRERDRREFNQQAVNAFLRFEETLMRDARATAWQVRTRWYTDPNQGQQFRERFLGRLLPRTQAQAIPPVGEIALDDVRALSRVMGFYQALSLIQCDDHQLRSLGFLYPYWRGFLRDVVNEYEHAYGRLPDRQQAMFPRLEFRECLDRLDGRLGLPAYDWREDPMYSGFDLNQFLSSRQGTSNNQAKPNASQGAPPAP
ncbi:MAG: hypothetical protein J0L64_10335 [Acidobacteria bacterium]|nr:hypothetical protein [Acidobacteriota bacterium]